MKKMSFLLFAILLIIISLAPKCKENQGKTISDSSKDTVIISLRRTPCYVTCPTYLLEIYRSGKVIYTGGKNVEKTGKFESVVSKEVIEKIIMKAVEVKFFEMADDYPVDKTMNVSDNPTYYTFISFDGKEKTIRNYYLPPKGLTELENLIDELTNNLSWKKLPEE